MFRNDYSPDVFVASVSVSEWSSFLAIKVEINSQPSVMYNDMNKCKKAIDNFPPSYQFYAPAVFLNITYHRKTHGRGNLT